jgi:hypothetical protein
MDRKELLLRLCKELTSAVEYFYHEEDAGRELLHLIEGGASCFTEGNALSTGFTSDCSSPRSLDYRDRY